jgi:hypothetical protein
MTPAARQTRQGLVASWVAQLVGTVVLCGVVLVFMRATGAPFASADANPEWQRYAIYAILLSAGPALIYLRTFKALLDADLAAERKRGVPDPELRRRLARALTLGGAMCELPMALGVVQLFFGGETRWFLGATLVTVAVRLSYRPFDKPPKAA